MTGIAEFRDLNVGVNSFQRTYVDEVRRVEDIARRLTYLDDQMQKANDQHALSESSDYYTSSSSMTPIVTMSPLTSEPNVPRYKEIIRLEANVDELDRNLRDVNEHLNSLRLKAQEFNEMNQVLLKTHKALEFTRSGSFSGEAAEAGTSSSAMGSGGSIKGRSGSILTGGEYLGSEQQQSQLAAFARTFGFFDPSNKLNTVTGVIRADKAAPFHTMIWRICGQNALVQFFDIEAPIDDVATEELVAKKVFLVMAQGRQLAAKLSKICEGFRATVYRVPAEAAAFRELSVQVETNMRDIKVVIEQTLKQKYRMLSALAQPENLPSWTVQVRKLRAVFATMNLFRRTEKGFIGQCWAAATDLGRLRARVEAVASRSAGISEGQAVIEVVPTTETPPTYYRSNKFTSGFQGIVDSYGVSRYREMNPAPYTAISFPFLFAVMFADAGHGFVMLLFALWMVLFERRLAKASSNEIWLMFFDGRYIILLMGAFSIYTGLIYNDVFAKSVNFFGSSWAVPPPEIARIEFNNATEEEHPVEQYLAKVRYLEKRPDSVYPFGIDPAWQLAPDNKIIFTNSFKMKVSVILGVMQMLFGVMLSLVNHINNRSLVSVLFEFIPQILFLLSLFGYMITLIFAKWLTVFDPPANAPSILIDFINMFLYKYPEDVVYLRPWFPHKKLLQTVLLLVALGSVPIMLLVKPTILVCCSGRSKKRLVTSNDLEMNELSGGHNNGANATTSNGGANSSNNNNNNNNAHSKAGSSKTDKAQDESHGGGGDHEGESTGDIYIHQAIHTIEFCLGSISHTASYLRLWALSLAHSQLSEVLWNMILKKGMVMEVGGLYGRPVILFCTFAVWAVLTVAILILMEGLSAFLHAIRLHWVEFQSKFYIGDGYAFQPFTFKQNNLADQD